MHPAPASPDRRTHRRGAGARRPRVLSPELVTRTTLPDGLFELVTIGDVGKLDLALNVHRLYLGTLAEHPRVDEVRARRVVIEAERQLPVEIDGELPGTTPVTFEVLPQALRLLVP